MSWSDAAREAAAAARNISKAHQDLPASTARSLGIQATERSAEAADASKDAGDDAEGHENASGAHEIAGKAHAKAAEAYEKEGNTKQADLHRIAAKAHGKATKGHDEASANALSFSDTPEEQADLTLILGGEGSGNFGHSGRPGFIGGSVAAAEASAHAEKLGRAAERATARAEAKGTERAHAKAALAHEMARAAHKIAEHHHRALGEAAKVSVTQGHADRAKAYGKTASGHYKSMRSASKTGRAHSGSQHALAASNEDDLLLDLSDVQIDMTADDPAGDITATLDRLSNPLLADADRRKASGSLGSSLSLHGQSLEGKSGPGFAPQLSDATRLSR